VGLGAGVRCEWLDRVSRGLVQSSFIIDSVMQLQQGSMSLRLRVIRSES